MKTTGKFLGLLASLFIVSNCSKNDSGVQAINEEQIKSPYSLSTNVSDPLFINYSGDDGEQINVYGIRDDQGLPSQVNLVDIKNTDGTANQFFVDEVGRPEYILSDNGTQFLFEWLNESQFALTVYAPDGENQINTLVDLSTDTSGSSQRTEIRTRDKKDKLSLSFIPGGFVQKSLENTSGIANAKIFVEQCGLPINASVLVNVQSASIGNYNHTFKANPISTGVYQVQIPDFAAETIDAQKVCAALESKLNIWCDIVGTPISQPDGLAWAAATCQATAIAAVTLSPVASAAVLNACNSMVAATALYCGTLGGSAAPNAPSVLESICKAEITEYTFEEDLKIFAYTPALPSDLKSDTYEGPQNGPFPDFLIDFGFSPKVQGFVLQPSAPAAGQDYQATISAFCLPLGTTVNINVSGSDGYTDSISYNISLETGSSGTFVLTVPGAESGVQDVCVVRINFPDGNVITKTASLVFN
jgi:hypothetical protein